MFRRQTGNLELIVNMYNTIERNLLPVERPLVDGLMLVHNRFRSRAINSYCLPSYCSYYV